MLLDGKGGACVIFGDSCCTFIPNNTAPHGSFRKPLTKLKTLDKELKNNAGSDAGMMKWFD